MAASATVSQLTQSRNSLKPRHGVLTLFGCGISVTVDRGHLVVKDGIGSDRHEGRFARVGHGVRRLVVIGSDGFLSLAALRWLADQDVGLFMLERTGHVLATIGPVHPSDARLRRAQALAHQSGAALSISRKLISQKLVGQERLVRDVLQNAPTANLIASARTDLAKAETISAIRLLESQAAHAYWSAWRALPINFPKANLSRVPDHWRTFGTRASPLTNSPRLATNPPNAILNYLYAVLESEARLAAAAMGLDPGIGIMHVDSPARDSLACDLMEPVRPQVDAYLLDWLNREPLRREWFFEERSGNCRLMGSFAVHLSETAPTWGRAVAPFAEWVAQTVWMAGKPNRRDLPATRLTQSHKRQAKGGAATLKVKPPPRPQCVCRGCGASLRPGKSYCAACGLVDSTERLVEIARRGRLVAQGPNSQTKRAETQRRNALAKHAWKPSDQPTWLTETFYRETIQPRLGGINATALARALHISRPYAADIRAGRCKPHPRHWEILARLAGVLGPA